MSTGQPKDFQPTEPGAAAAPTTTAVKKSSPPSGKFHLLWSAALWAVSLYAVLSMAKAYLAHPTWQPWFMLPVVLLIANPWLRSFCGRWVLPPAAAVLLALFLNAIGVALFRDFTRWEQAAADEQRIADSLRKRDEQRARALAEFNADKAGVLRGIETLLSQNQVEEAFSKASRYLAVTKDPDLARLHSRAEVAKMKLELVNEEALPLERREAIYRTLMREEPQTAEQFRGRMVAVTNALESKRKIERLTAAAPGQFAGPGGPHRLLELHVRSSLNDPGSYQHVRTAYGIGDDGISIEMTFRARNAFGGILTKTVYGKADADGNLVYVSKF